MDILGIILLVAAAGICSSELILSPQRAEVLEGESVLLTCASEINRDVMLWLWSSRFQQIEIFFDSSRGECTELQNDRFGLGYEEMDRRLYSVSCIENSTSVLMQNISRTRHGERWTCWTGVNRSNRSNDAFVYVTVPVTSVQIDRMEKVIATKENTILHLSCQTTFARPAANITWYLTEGISGRERRIPLLAEHIGRINNSTEELFSTISEITINVNRSFDGRFVYCSANNYPGVTVSSAKLLFDVEYIANVISFFVKGFEGKDIITVLENDTVQFICLIDTIASNATLTFHWKTVLVEEFDTSNLTYTLHRVSCRDTGDYTCVGRNALNHGEPSFGHMTLLVKCPPHVHPYTPVQENVLAKRGDVVTFILDIIAYPEPRWSDFVWMKLTNANWTRINNGLHMDISVRGQQTNLTIMSVTEEDYGKYLLTVTNGLGSYSQNFYLQNAEELSDNNVIAIATGSAAGSGVLVGMIIVAIFLARNAKQKRESPCISIITKCKGGKETSTIPSTLPSTAAEPNENSISSGPQNIYEQLQRNGEVEKEYQEIQLGEDEKCVYKNSQLHPPPATR